MIRKVVKVREMLAKAKCEWCGREYGGFADGRFCSPKCRKEATGS